MLALKAAQRIWDVRSNWASYVGHFNGLWEYASTHHGAQQGEAARRSSDMRQARHLPQRWYWSIVVQVRDVIRQFTQGTLTAILTLKQPSLVFQKNPYWNPQN
ncbi:hypothetical protein TNCV_3196711 [Trichonephila clavipes]|nr:hypothetical protein TNCV_3196711 [Trichonephila clavipes]